MFFFLMRILPFILPVLYFFELKGLFYFPSWWPAIIATIVAGNLLNFAFIKFKNRQQKIFLYFLYTSVFLALGFVFSMILENFWIINIFSVIWSLIYLILLEAYFYDIYQTVRADLLSLREIVPYTSLVMAFFLSSILFYFSIFLSFSWYWAALIFIFCVYVILRQFFYYQPLDEGNKVIYCRIGVLVFSEIFITLIFLPLSFYVLGALITVLFFLFVSLSTAYLNKNLNYKTISKPIATSILILILILATAAWF